MSRPSAPERPRPPAMGPVSSAPRAKGWHRFAQRYGWRAYALPILVVVSVLALFSTSNHSVRQAIGAGPPPASGGGGTGTTGSGGTAGPANAKSSSQLKVDTPGAGSLKTALPALQLPPGPKYTTTGKGTFSTIPGTSKVVGTGGRLYKYSIEVENGVTGVNLTQFAATVMSSLYNARSWTSTGQVELQRVQSGAVDFHVSLTSSMTVRTLCGYTLPVETSCYDGGDSRVVLNVARWVRGARVFASDLATYRIYAVNHEVGHALGHNHAHECLSNGVAPVMMQQTIGNKTAEGKICAPNPWPYPVGAKDAPGAEQPGDTADMQFYNNNSR